MGATQPTGERRTVSLREFAETFGVSYRHAARMARRGDLPGAIRLGRRVVIPTATVERLLAGVGSGGTGRDHPAETR